MGAPLTAHGRGMQMYGSQLEEAEAELAELKAQVAAQGTLRANQVCVPPVSGGTAVPRVPFIPVEGHGVPSSHRVPFACKAELRLSLGVRSARHRSQTAPDARLRRALHVCRVQGIFDRMFS